MVNKRSIRCKKRVVLLVLILSCVWYAEGALFKENISDSMNTRIISTDLELYSTDTAPIIRYSILNTQFGLFQIHSNEKKLSYPYAGVVDFFSQLWHAPQKNVQQDKSIFFLSPAKKTHDTFKTGHEYNLTI